MSIGSSSLLGGRYRLESRVGIGGMGEIWRARDVVLERVVAVKFPAPGYAADPEFRRRFHLEARHAAAVSHPNIANVYDFGAGSADDPPFLVMELVEGEPLSARIARQGALPPEEVVALAAQVADALQAAHRVGLVHRDIKPANLLLCPDGTVKVTDFGIARASGAAPATGSGALLGTAQYLAPEQVAGWAARAASDLYSLGVVGYECLTGRRPFDGDPITVATAHLNQQPDPLPTTVPAPLATLIGQLLAKDPAQRPSSAGAVANELRRIAGEEMPRRLAGTAPRPRPELGASSGPTVTEYRIRLLRGPMAQGAARERTDRRLIGIGAAAVLAIGLIVFAVTGNSPSLSAGTRAATQHKPPRPTHFATSSALVPVHPVAVSLFEPNGGNDDPTGVGYADDGNLATAWRTEWYTTANFGGLKPGVGLVFDLGRPVAVRQLALALLNPGTGVEVWAGNSPGDLLHASLVASWAAAPANVQERFANPVSARYWLVFLDRLPDTPVGYASGIREVSFAS